MRLVLLVAVAALSAVLLVNAKVLGDAPAERNGTDAELIRAACGIELYPDACMPAEFCAFRVSLTSSGKLSGARALAVDTEGDVLISSRNGGAAVLHSLQQTQAGLMQISAINLVSGLGNHGILLWSIPSSGSTPCCKTWVLISSSTKVYAAPYTAGQRTHVDPDHIVTIVESIPSGGHWTRSLAKLPDGRLAVSIGSLSNIDNDSSRSGIKAFNISSILALAQIFVSVNETDFGVPPLDWDTHGKWASRGVRNAVALTTQPTSGALWAAVNGLDSLSDPAKPGGTNISEENPCEEVFRVRGSGEFHGYPFCWPAYDLPPEFPRSEEGPGAMHVTPQHRGGNYSDEWCAGEAVLQPDFCLPGHFAPLGARFQPKLSEDERARAVYSPPEQYDGDLYIFSHGSWNRAVPQGYAVLRVPFNKTTNEPLDKTMYSEVLAVCRERPEDSMQWPSGLRPVDGVFLKDGTLLVSSDSSSEVIGIRYYGRLRSPEGPSPTPSATSMPTANVTAIPSRTPTASPSDAPSPSPFETPTFSATAEPSVSPTPTHSSGDPSFSPTETLGLPTPSETPVSTASPSPTASTIPPGAAECFPGSSEIIVRRAEDEDGSKGAISSLQVGDVVADGYRAELLGIERNPGGQDHSEKCVEFEWTTVHGFGHQDAFARSESLIEITYEPTQPKLISSSGKSGTSFTGGKLVLTSGHVLILNGALRFASSAKVGDQLSCSVVASGSCSVVRVVPVKSTTSRHLSGLYNPHSLSGTLIVNGVRVSCYTSAIRVGTAHALLAPARGLFRALAVDVTTPAISAFHSVSSFISSAPQTSSDLLPPHHCSASDTELLPTLLSAPGFSNIGHVFRLGWM